MWELTKSDKLATILDIGKLPLECDSVVGALVYAVCQHLLLSFDLSSSPSFTIMKELAVIICRQAKMHKQSKMLVSFEDDDLNTVGFFGETSCFESQLSMFKFQ